MREVNIRKYGQGVSGGLFRKLRMRKFSKSHGASFVGGRAAHLDAIPVGSRSVGEGCSLFVSGVWGLTGGQKLAQVLGDVRKGEFEKGTVL